MTAIGIIGGVISAIGAIVQAQAAASAATFNAKINERNARAALEQGAADAKQQQRVNAIKLGQLRAAFGDAGIGFGGDALGVFSDAITQTELDLANVRYSAKLRSIGYEDQAKLDRMEASAASTAGIFGAFSALVGAGSSILRAA